MTFPNYEAIEAISSINIASQALQQQAIPLFSNPVELKKDDINSEEYKRIEVVRTQAEKLKLYAESILNFLK
jgi:hypothetical protein